MVSVGLIQASLSQDPVANRDKIIENIRQCADKGAQIIATQELCTSLYFCQEEEESYFDLAEPIPGPSTEALQKEAASLGVVIIASLFEQRLTGLYHNTAVVIDADGSLLGLYRKMHIPDDPDYYEKYYFTPGDLGYQAFHTRYACIGVLICWDQWFPEAARSTALQGADILFYPTSIGWQDHEYETQGTKQHQAWETSQRAHAIANGLYVCAINRVGRENKINFWGQSFVCDPFGSILHRAASDRQENIVHTLDLKKNEQIRRAWPFLRDRRVDSYQDLLRLGPR